MFFVWLCGFDVVNEELVVYVLRIVFSMFLILLVVIFLFMFFKFVFEEDVCVLIIKVFIKCCLLDFILFLVFVQLLDVFIFVIMIMINLFFEIGQFVSDWKEVLLLFVFKKVGLEVVFKNFCFISNFFFVLKLLE